MGKSSRTVFLVDMNCFFIACEALQNPSLRRLPAAVAGDPKKRSGIILTANYAARKYGVRTAMTLYQAKKLCPEIELVPPNRKLYEEKSRAVMELLVRYTPVVEQNSIDEAWLDMTGCEGIWGKPLEAAHTIMDRINNELGLWCSIGISENKFLAKMAADLKKPQGISELWFREVPQKLWPLPVGDLYGIGKQTAAKLQATGLRTIGDLAAYGRDVLRSRFGKYGEEMSLLANGIDDSPVVPHEEGERKSIGRSTTMPQDVTNLQSAKDKIADLAEEVGAELRHLGKKCSTVHITVKFADFQSITRQQTVPPTNLTKQIIASANELLQKSWTNRAARLLGVSVSGFESVEDVQLSLFGQQDNSKLEREEKLERAVDTIRDKYGSESVQRAIFLNRDETS
jgi:DNA polymerase-4